MSPTKVPKSPVRIIKDSPERYKSPNRQLQDERIGFESGGFDQDSKIFSNEYNIEEEEQREIQQQQQNQYDQHVQEIHQDMQNMTQFHDIIQEIRAEHNQQMEQMKQYYEDKIGQLFQELQRKQAAVTTQQ